MDKPRKVVWCLSDGKPGHFNQTKGLLQALEIGYTLEVHWLEVRLKWRFLRKLLRKLSNKRTGAAFIRACYTLTSLPAAKPDLVCSAGGNTAFLNTLLACEYQCENYFIGSLRGMRPDLFSQILTIEAIPGATNNIVMDLAPVPFNAEQQEKAAQPLLVTAQQPLWALLIGGQTSEYPYSDQDWRQLAENLNQMAETHQIRWLLTTSRRTGPDVERLLKSLIKPDVLADVTWFGAEPRKVMAAYLGAAEQIFCTVDSLSMLTEAISTGKPVVAVEPENAQPNLRYHQALERLVKRGWLERQPANSLSAVSFQAGGERASPHQALWQQIKASQ